MPPRDPEPLSPSPILTPPELQATAPPGATYHPLPSRGLATIDTTPATSTTTSQANGTPRGQPEVGVSLAPESGEYSGLIFLEKGPRWQEGGV